VSCESGCEGMLGERAMVSQMRCPTSSEIGQGAVGGGARGRVRDGSRWR
jgi:hypothetical protein